MKSFINNVAAFALAQSLRNLLSTCVVAGQLSDSLKFFVGQKRKMLDKNNRVLHYLNKYWSFQIQ